MTWTMTVALSLNRSTEIKQVLSVIFPNFPLGEVQKAGIFRNIQFFFPVLQPSITWLAEHTVLCRETQGENQYSRR